jgi:hypothetical protein
MEGCKICKRFKTNCLLKTLFYNGVELNSDKLPGIFERATLLGEVFIAEKV